MQDVIVHVEGTSAIVRSLRWGGKADFDRSQREIFWVWDGEEGRGRIAGYYNQGGGLVSQNWTDYFLVVFFRFSLFYVRICLRQIIAFFYDSYFNVIKHRLFCISRVGVHICHGRTFAWHWRSKEMKQGTVLVFVVVLHPLMPVRPLDTEINDNYMNKVSNVLFFNKSQTYLVVRNAGHMVPISQPLWARRIAKEFTRRRPKGDGDQEVNK